MSNSVEDRIGHGASIEIPPEISTEQVWAALIIKITQPNLFVPASDVVTRPSDDGLGVYREMTVGGNRMIENVYVNKDIFEIRSEVSKLNQLASAFV